MTKKNFLLHKLINAGQGKSQIMFAAFALGIGALLLFVAVQAYVDVDTLLYGNANKNNMADFLIINKKITNAMMGNPQASLFTADEMSEIQREPFVKAMGKITSNQFKVSASAGRTLPFSTDLFFESVPDNFMDTLPPHWQWKESDPVLPVILSSDFLSLYNYGFALSQGLPQLSEKSIKAIPISINISNGIQSTSFIANITGFSDRISSILVPQSFMEWANKNYGYEGAAVSPPSRLILKVDDPSNPAFVKFLNEHDYVTNRDKLKFSKARLIVQSTVSVIGAFGLLILLLSLIIFSIYIRLIISRSKEEIKLLVTLGYSPKRLSKFLRKKMTPLYAIIIAACVVITALLQAWLHHFLIAKQLELNRLISYFVIILAVILFLLIYWVNKKTIRKSVMAVQ